jgi:hypothetical protein
MVGEMKIAVIVVAGTQKQNECFFPSYKNCNAGIHHDLIVVHRNGQYLNSVENPNGSVILENKVINGEEVPHRAFGAYRHFWNLYKDKYDAFAFISDDVIVKSDEWLEKSMNLLFKYDRLGFVGTQIMNGQLGQYPHPSHNRAPCWFAKSSALKNIDWKFDSDHDGEMALGDQMAAEKYFGAQVGMKIDVGYDALENGGYWGGDHIISCMEKSFQHELMAKFEPEEIRRLHQNLMGMLDRGEDVLTATSPHPHIGTRRVVSQLQPFHGLLYDRSEQHGLSYCNKYPFGINILK